jgi:ribose transport system ATP-binding protein
MSTPDQPMLLQMEGIDKSFPGVVALDNVELLVRRGEVHAIVGENGAGKSTLMKILAGVYQPDAGDIVLDGEAVAFANPDEAIKKGISVIYQEIPLVPTLTVLSNIFLGREPVTRMGAIDRRLEHAQYMSLCNQVGVFVDPDARVGDLTRGQQQLVEILKALHRDAQVIVMDEPTAALDQASKQALVRTVRMLQGQGKTFIFITHFIGEVFELAQRITVLRDGRNVATVETANTSAPEVVSMMIGRALSDVYPDTSARSGGKALLEVRNLNVGDVLADISFTLHEGEILGLAGLVGSGRTELVLALYGRLPVAKGEVVISGQHVRIDEPFKGIAHGFGLLPEDRKRTGLIMEFPVYKNLSLSALARLSPRFVIQSRAEQRHARSLIQRLRISTPSPDQRVRYLSGGNQQKVVLGRILATDARILMLDEPTQGIDVGAKEEIFQLMRRLADDGKGIIFISSELKEIAGVCNRALVLKDGRIVRELLAGEITENSLLQAAVLGATQ